MNLYKPNLFLNLVILSDKAKLEFLQLELECLKQKRQTMIQIKGDSSHFLQKKREHKIFMEESYQKKREHEIFMEESYQKKREHEIFMEESYQKKREQERLIDELKQNMEMKKLEMDKLKDEYESKRDSIMVELFDYEIKNKELEVKVLNGGSERRESSNFKDLLYKEITSREKNLEECRDLVENIVEVSDNKEDKLKETNLDEGRRNFIEEILELGDIKDDPELKTKIENAKRDNRNGQLLIKPRKVNGVQVYDLYFDRIYIKRFRAKAVAIKVLNANK
jgi:hypothetical protein